MSGLAAGLIEKFGADMLVEKQGKPVYDDSGYMVKRGGSSFHGFKGKIAKDDDCHTIKAVCFDEFCTGDKIHVKCGPFEGQCFTITHAVKKSGYIEITAA